MTGGYRVWRQFVSVRVFIVNIPCWPPSLAPRKCPHHKYEAFSAMSIVSNILDSEQREEERGELRTERDGKRESGKVEEWGWSKRKPKEEIEKIKKGKEAWCWMKNEGWRKKMEGGRGWRWEICASVSRVYHERQQFYFMSQVVSPEGRR